MIDLAAEVDCRNISKSSDELESVPRLSPFHRLPSHHHIFEHLSSQRHADGFPPTLLDYHLESLPLQTLTDDLSTRTMSRLEQIHCRLYREVKKRRRKLESMDRVRVNDVVLAVDLELGLVYSVERSVHTLLYCFHRPLRLLNIPDEVGVNDSEFPTGNSIGWKFSNPFPHVMDIVNSINSVDGACPAHELQVANVESDINEHSGWFISGYSKLLKTLKFLYKKTLKAMLIQSPLLSPSDEGTDEPDGSSQLWDHFGNSLSLTCLGVEMVNRELRGMVCDQHGEVTNGSTELYYLPAQFVIVRDGLNTSSPYHIVSILCLGMGPNQDFFLSLFTDNTRGTRFAVEKSTDGNGKNLQVPTDRKFHFRMKKATTGYRFQADSGDQRYLAFTADGTQAAVYDQHVTSSPSNLNSQFVFMPIPH